jgi:hypothetical protein
MSGLNIHSAVAAAMRHSPPGEIRHLLIINAPVFYRLK